jgi:hypothetical protein
MVLIRFMPNSSTQWWLPRGARQRCASPFCGLLAIVRRVLREQMSMLHGHVLAAVRNDEVCHRLMTVPGVGTSGGVDLSRHCRCASSLSQIKVGRGRIRIDAR